MFYYNDRITLVGQLLKHVEHFFAIVAGGFIAAQNGYGERRRHKGIRERGLGHCAEFGNGFGEFFKAEGFFHDRIVLSLFLCFRFAVNAAVFLFVPVREAEHVL